MKKIQIEQDLFVQMVKYFFSDELGFDDYDVSEFYHDIKKGLTRNLTPSQSEAITLNIKPLIHKKKEKKQD